MCIVWIRGSKESTAIGFEGVVIGGLVLDAVGGAVVGCWDEFSHLKFKSLKRSMNVSARFVALHVTCSVWFTDVQLRLRLLIVRFMSPTFTDMFVMNS